MRARGFLFFTLTLCFLSGCNTKDHVHFGGKVTLPDGTPYTKGFVCFTKGSISAMGPLRQDGTYSLGSFKENDGLPPGRYQVYLSGFQQVDQTRKEKSGAPILVSDIDLKFERPETSGLECEVGKGGRFDFTVEPLNNK